MSEIITKFRDLSKSVAEAFQIYFAKLEYTGFSGVEPYLSDEITKDLKLILSNTELSQYASNKSFSFEDIFEVYFIIINYYQKLTKILNIYSTHQIDLSRQGSFTSTGTTLTLTFIKDLAETYENINYIYQSYKTEILSINLDDFLNINIDLIKNINIKEIDHINKIYADYFSANKGNLVVDLYSFILHRIILNNTEKEIIKYVNKTVEKLKTQVLETDEIKNVGDQNKLINTVQNLIQMHNLVPTSMSMPLSELISILGVKTKSDDLEKYLNNVCKALSKDKKFGFIVFTKIINRPLEYNFWTIFDKNYLEKHKLLQSAEVGLNEKILERYQTIIQLDNESGKSKTKKAEDSILILNKEFVKAKDEIDSQNYYYIIETIDGENYRFLTPFGVSGKEILYVPASWFENIQEKKYSPSRRLELYNLNTSSEILKHLTKPVISMDILTREEVQKEENYWRSIRNKIKIQIIDYFTDLFTEKFIELGKSKSSAKKGKKEQKLSKLTLGKVTDLILNDDLYKATLNFITENIELDSIAGLSERIRPEVLSQFQVELTLSYFYDLAGIQRNIKRDVENIYRREYYEKVGAFISRSDSKKLYVKNKVIEIYSAIIDEVLEKFVNRKSGIYLSIQKKFDILSKTLI